MDLSKIKNPKDSNVFRMGVIIAHPTPSGSNVYRINYDLLHSTPMGSYQSDEYGFSINMLSLRDNAQQLTNK